MCKKGKLRCKVTEEFKSPRKRVRNQRGQMYFFVFYVFFVFYLVFLCFFFVFYFFVFFVFFVLFVFFVFSKFYFYLNKKNKKNKKMVVPPPPRYTYVAILLTPLHAMGEKRFDESNRSKLEAFK